MKSELIESKETIEYIKGILDGKSIVFNPMKLNIPEVGEVIATSMVRYWPSGDEAFPYFTFEDSKGKGRFFRKDSKYFIMYRNQEAVKK